MGFTRTQEYQPLREPSDDSLPLYEKVENHAVKHEARFWRRSFTILAIWIVASSILNLSLVWQVWSPTGAESHGSYTSRYAGLAPDTMSRTIRAYNEYVSEDNLTATSENWEWMNGDSGVVALDDSFVAAKGLPPGLRWPWDETKGVYLLQGHHNLHCLRTVYRSIMDYHYERPQRVALVHILHCLDELRQDTICKADDTPRYATSDPPGTGQGQVRQCRDWNRLEQWAAENSACFKHVDGKRGPIVERFKTCPHGEQPWLTT